ncbi:BppU family phage baseplate upper protein [Mammaliicoccus fleurettii]|uniref:BppU family phage baseplate upper protein n=1 Tax=Mammaliicoccus fleurettii TaxID=150056 RepID=UPI001AAD6DF8|nr:BppU family phage baseplate upper protein [Mammaliicoccus fleurettii]MBO3062710.1 BppU family phage baseplate upper protein [Mammaliicoccus fleurettii]
MENGINKTGFFNATVEPHLRPISDLGIGFYNLDENTAKLRFQLSNSAGTLLISDENLKVYGYFESSNGSVSDVIELDIVDELNGIVEITLDQDFLHASTSTKVKGQLYIGVQNVSGKPEYNEVAVLGEFTFEVADALINKISSFTKVEYIRMFSQLKAQIEKEVQYIQEAIKNGADYVAEMNTVKEQGVTAINKTVTDGKIYIDNVIAQAQTNINDTATSAITDVGTAKDNAISAMNTKVSESVSNVENVSTGAITHVDEKLTEFNTHIEENGFVQPTDLDNKLNGLTWQKSKLTNDDGRLQQLAEFDFDNPELMFGEKSQFAYVSSSLNYPIGSSGNGTVMYLVVTADYKRIEYRPNGSNKIFYRRKEAGVWLDWKEVTQTQTDTGWIPFLLINGALSNTAYKDELDGGFDCAYRTITNGSETKRILRINGTNLVQNQVIAQLPSGFVKTAQTFPIRIPLKYSGAYLAIRPSGEVRFYINGDASAWSPSDYAYGQCEWTD